MAAVRASSTNALPTITSPIAFAMLWVAAELTPSRDAVLAVAMSARISLAKSNATGVSSSGTVAIAATASPARLAATDPIQLALRLALALHRNRSVASR